MNLQKYIQTSTKYTTVQKKALIELVNIIELKNNGEIDDNDFEKKKNKVIENAIQEEKEIKNFDVIKDDMRTEFKRGSIGKSVYESSIKQFEENRKKFIKVKQDFYNNELNMLIDLDPSEIEIKEQKIAIQQEFKSYNRVFLFYFLSLVFFVIGIFYFPTWLLSILFAMLGLGYTIIGKLNILIEQNNR